ncbi:hypothetical protein AAV94_12125 [Lampropedia cohaerens]|uniref:Uncharacterized protein n=1 Tax=Lampropedia cohaerens TaxID=1610491 RepID=A0A0U1PX15_9BURK|nr:hypothetical protein AAV94_12125 [Lampropedia cohaerens]
MHQNIEELVDDRFLQCAAAASPRVQGAWREDAAHEKIVNRFLDQARSQHCWHGTAPRRALL